MGSWVRVTVALACTAVLGLSAGSASAEGDFDYSVPTDGATVGEPIREIRVAFTGPVTLVGAGFEVIDPAGESLIPFVATDDDMVFKLQLDAPIGGGAVVVSYQVRVESGWVVRGGFEFGVAAEVTTTTEGPTATTIPTAGSPTTVATVPTAAATTVVTSTTDPTAIDTTIAEAEPSGAGIPAAPVAAAVVAVVALAFVVLRSKLRWQGVDQ